MLLVLANNARAQSKEPSKRPNIIFILADDLGYGNISSYNPTTPVPTPNIDQMAKEGSKFTRFYAGSTVCAPSRASLMTGLHMGHAYVRGNAKAPLRPQDTTLAQYFQAGGYVTGMFGKWALGESNQTGAVHLKGFNEFFGYVNQTHAHHYFTTYLDEIKDGVTRSIKVDSSKYTQDLIMERALAFLSRNKNKPFFLYLPLTLPHAELQVPKSLLKEFQNHDGSSKLGPETPFQKRERYNEQTQPRAAFAAMMTRLDRDVARILEAVKSYGLDDNTYIFFTSDNGPHQEGGGDPVYFNSSGPLRGLKRDLYEGGIRVPMLVRAPGRVPSGVVSDVPWAFWDIMPTLGDLANVKTAAKTDGLSFTALLTGKNQKDKHEYFYWQFNEGAFKEALIKDDWKLIRFKEKGAAEVLELYRFKDDIGEKYNLAPSNPAKVKELKALMLKAKSPAENKVFDWSDVEL